ncbi:glycosyltransferase family 2 protein [Bacillus sp. MRMR6]|uniref:glycosyltransferase family 2 protein n=1 Tax=Bacillus sp. MRMR6 TaxID=1928617 RepID=UPI000951D40D|nr:glycosyltransferase family 2 protein [Bacillus sp. MRMR6]OLS38440.1 hypothetical protein BTR25_14765 [Bacillus sp. MRMR6]
MRPKALVSFIIPIYNSEKYLDKTIESVLNQSYRDIEVLLINDGSKDNSLFICEKYKAFDNRVRVYTHKNQGVSVTRNIGIEASKGKYIRFIDSDDIIPTHSTRILVEVAEKNGAQIVIGGHEERRKNNSGNYKVMKYFAKGKIYTLNDFAAEYLALKKKRVINALWNKLFSLQLIKDNNLKFDLDLSLGEDLVFNLGAFRQSEKIITIENSVYIYFIRDELSLSQKFYNDKYKIIQRLLKAEKEFAELYKVEISDYLITNKINEGLYHIESILKNKDLTYKKKKVLVEQTNNDWELLYAYKKYKLSRFNKFLLRLLRFNQLFLMMIICKMKKPLRRLIVNRGVK